MAEFQYIDVPHGVHVLALLLDLGISGKQYRKPASVIRLIARQQHDGVAVLVPFDLLARPQHTTGKSPGAYAIPRVQLQQTVRKRRQLTWHRRGGTAGDNDVSDRIARKDIGQAAPMVFIPMGDNDRIELENVISDQRIHHLIVHARIDQNGMRAVANEDRIGLAHVQHGNARGRKPYPVRKPSSTGKRNGTGTEQDGSLSRTRPAPIQVDRKQEKRAAQRRGRPYAQTGEWDSRARANKKDRPSRQCSKKGVEHSRDRPQRGKNHVYDSQRKNHRDAGNEQDVGQRSNKRKLFEHVNRNRQRRGLRDKRKAKRFAYPAGQPQSP